MDHLRRVHRPPVGNRWLEQRVAGTVERDVLDQNKPDEIGGLPGRTDLDIENGYYHVFWIFQVLSLKYWRVKLGQKIITVPFRDGPRGSSTPLLIVKYRDANQVHALYHSYGLYIFSRLLFTKYPRPSHRKSLNFFFQ